MLPTRVSCKLKLEGFRKFCYVLNWNICIVLSITPFPTIELRPYLPWTWHILSSFINFWNYRKAFPLIASSSYSWRILRHFKDAVLLLSSQQTMLYMWYITCHFAPSQNVLQMFYCQNQLGIIYCILTRFIVQ